MKTTVFKIFEDQSVRSEYDWKIVLGEDGRWGYTTSKNYKVGGTVDFEVRNLEFINYCITQSWKEN